MKTKRNLFALAVLVSICICFLQVSSTNAIEKSIEVNTYSLPENRTDTARAIDAYQQMINRLLDTNERNTIEINRRLAKIEESLKRIENNLGIKPQTCPVKTDKKPKQHKKTTDNPSMD